MKRTLLCALAAFACACSTESRTDEKILEAFEKHSYELHDSGELAAELKARGPGVLRFFDPRSALLGAPRGLKVKAPKADRLYSTGMLLGPCGTSACVLRVLRGSPADRAGIQDYERIVSAGGSGGAAGEVLDALGKGVSGLVLAGRGGERELPLPAPSFRAPPVFGLYDPATRTAYLRVAVFSRGVAAQVAKGLAAFKAADPRAIVLDLRYSIGGVPEEAAAVFRLFAGRGAECFAIRSRHKGYSVDFPAADGGPFAGRPLAVLVNSSTAMAAEALAAALKENGAAVYGSRTAGSVSISRTFELEKDAFLRLSVARYFAPSGAELEDKGVVPDREITPPEGFEELWRAPAESLFFRDAAWKAAVTGRRPSSAS